MDTLDDGGHRAKRFKYQSYAETLKKVHAPSALQNELVQDDIGDNDSHFHEALEHWKQLNLAPSFIQFAHQAGPLSASMPLLLHNWREIVDLWLKTLESADDEALRALLDLVQCLTQDLRTTLSPAYTEILGRLLNLVARQISAEALTALLSTFQAVFKHLLVPSADLELQEQTWRSLRETLPSCLPDVQRALGEVWGTTLRRLKAAARERAVEAVAADVSGIDDSAAWMIVTACKSVSQTLHTATVSVISPLLAYHLSCADCAPTYTLLRRALTSMIHHVKGPEGFTAVADILVQKFLEIAHAPTSDEETERLCRITDILSVPCASRQGSRLTQKHIEAILAALPNIPFSTNADLQSALLKLTVASLIASDSTLALGPGRVVLEHAWGCGDALYAVQLHGALAALGWRAWRVAALPGVLRASSSILAKERGAADEGRMVVGLLAALHREDKLGDVDVVWRQRLDQWVVERLEAWRGTEEEVNELEDILALAKYLPTLSPQLVRIIEDTLDKGTPDTHADVAARGLALCLHGLAKRDRKEWCKTANLLSWSQQILSSWGHSETVLTELLALTQASSFAGPGIDLDSVCSPLLEAILSQSRASRLAALGLLTSSLVSAPAAVVEIATRCLQGEEAAPDVHGVRERVLRISRVTQVVRDGDDVGADLCSRWLVAQLKVNLRPVWAPATHALAELADRFGDVVWRLMFAELQSVACHYAEDTMREPEDIGGPEHRSGFPREDERTWRDPRAQKMQGVLLSWTANGGGRSTPSEMSTRADRLDRRSYELQLLATLAECSSLAEKHSRDLIPFFLSLDEGDNDKIPRQKLSAWLNLFGKFKNPKALHSTERLHALYMSLISHPDRALQLAALSCIFTYKSPRLGPHEDELRALLDDARARDQLTSLDLTIIEAHDRAELVDVLIRVLFGMMLDRRGRNRRPAVLSALAGCTDEELGLLVDLMLKPLGIDRLARRGEPFAVRVVPAEMAEKQQLGLLNLLGDVLKSLGARLVDYWPALLGATIDLTAHAQKSLSHIGDTEEDEEVVDVNEEPPSGKESGSSSRLTRSIRLLGLKRFADFFRSSGTFNFGPFMPAAFSSFISPRLAVLDRENTQAPSALLDVFYSWSLRDEYVEFLADYDDSVLPKVYDCLTATNVKPTVISRVLDLVDSVLVISSGDAVLAKKVVEPHVSRLLTNLALLMERSKDGASVATPLGQRQLSILSQVAQYSNDSAQATILLSLFTPVLRKPAKLVPEKVKVDILNILCNLFPLIPGMSDCETTVHTKTYALLSSLLQTLRSRPARMGLVATFRSLSLIDPSLQRVTDLIDSLNAYSSKRMDEPDFNLRLNAFARLNEELHKSLSHREWLPLIYNMLYCLQDTAELTIRNSASHCLRHFVDLVAEYPKSEHELTFMRILYPGLKHGLRSKSEMVRTEVLNVLAYAVAKCEHITVLQEMHGLLAGGDEEANFFNNIHHVQVHRRTRALRRLSEYCDGDNLRSNTLCEIFVPLVSNYVTSTASLDHHLVNEAIITMGRLANKLAWGAYYGLVQKYIKASKDKDESERVYVRALVAVLDNFHFSMEEACPSDDAAETVDADGVEDDGGETAIPPAPLPPARPTQDSTIARIADAVNARLLPNLLQYLEKRDATTEDSTRIPIAIGVVRIVKHLPEATREAQIGRLVTVLTQILRSRSQETRDLTRDTLAKIAIALGPSYLPLIIREMRAALLRGPQLHVLAHVTHALLVHVTSSEEAAFDRLDNVVDDVAFVSAEVIFGQSGKDVQAEEFKTKMREVRSSASKGMDSFAILARHITPSRISGLLAPLRSIMQETESVKVMGLVDEVLKRVTGGLNANKELGPTELLLLCHTLIQQNARFLQQIPSRHKAGRKDAAIVQLKRRTPLGTDHYSQNSYRFIVFGLDLLNTALKRNRFDFRDVAVMSRLEAMVDVIGNVLYSSSTPVIVLALKAASALAKCPLQALDTSLPVFLRQILNIIKQVGSTEAEVAQVAFKSLAAILRDGPDVQVQEKDLIYLLELLSPDLEEPSRQTAVFAMLRSIVSRKFVVPEIYDLMDRVSDIMVTSQSPQVQEQCRAVLLQFLLDYPQGKGRLKTQMVFLAKNLSYVYESGRKSVMELLGAVVAKFDASLMQEYADLLFVALVMVLANDDSPKCKEMASQVIKTLFTRLDGDRQRAIVAHLHLWAEQHEQPQLPRVSSQVSGLLVDVLQRDVQPFLPSIMPGLHDALRRSSRQLCGQDDGDEFDVSIEWQVPYHACTLLYKVLRVFPESIRSAEDIPWIAVQDHLLFPHAWVRIAACRLLGMLFNAIPPASTSCDQDDTADVLTLVSVDGVRGVAGKLCQQLRSNHLDAALATQIVKNLVWTGKYFCTVESVPNSDEGGEALDDHDDESEHRQHPLPWLFSKLSYQFKSAHIARRNRSSVSATWSQQPLAILRWFAAMAQYMDAARLNSFLVHVLTPVYRVIDDDTIRDAQMDELKTTAVELQDLVQAKVGTTAFADVYNRIRQGVLGVRRERRVDRAVRVTVNPQAAAQRHMKRNTSKKESRKRKAQEFAERKGKRSRRE